jgi:hypothetical protein
MDIGLIASTHSTTLPLRSGPEAPARAAADAPARREEDRVEWNATRRVRVGLVEEVKAQIAAGTYLTSARLDAALERLMSDLDITA